MQGGGGGGGGGGRGGGGGAGAGAALPSGVQSINCVMGCSQSVLPLCCFLAVAHWHPKRRSYIRIVVVWMITEAI